MLVPSRQLSVARRQSDSRPWCESPSGATLGVQKVGNWREMYGCSIDAQRGLAVWCFGSDKVSPKEWERHCSDVKALREWTHLTSRPCVLIHTLGGLFVPNAQQRQQIAELSSHPDYRPNLAVVSSNPLIRGVIQVFTWLQNAQPYRIAAFDDVGSALFWLEEDRGEPLPEMLRLLNVAQLQAGIRVNGDSRPPPPSSVSAHRR